MSNPLALKHKSENTGMKKRVSFFYCDEETSFVKLPVAYAEWDEYMKPPGLHLTIVDKGFTIPLSDIRILYTECELLDMYFQSVLKKEKNHE